MDDMTAMTTSARHTKDGLAAVEEAVTIRRELAATRPDAYRKDLAGH